MDLDVEQFGPYEAFSHDDIDNLTAHHPPANASVAKVHEMVRHRFADLMHWLKDWLPAGGDLKDATIFQLVRAMHLANSSVACDGNQDTGWIEYVSRRIMDDSTLDTEQALQRLGDFLFTHYADQKRPNEHPLDMVVRLLSAADSPAHHAAHRITNEQAAGLVFEALGAASVCWSEPPAGEFRSERAAQVGNGLLADLGFEVPESHRVRQVKPAVVPDLPAPTAESSGELLARLGTDGQKWALRAMGWLTPGEADSLKLHIEVLTNQLNDARSALLESDVDSPPVLVDEGDYEGSGVTGLEPGDPPISITRGGIDYPPIHQNDPVVAELPEPGPGVDLATGTVEAAEKEGHGD